MATHPTGPVLRTDNPELVGAVAGLALRSLAVHASRLLEDLAAGVERERAVRRMQTAVHIDLDALRLTGQLPYHRPLPRAAALPAPVTDAEVDALMALGSSA